MFLSECLLVTIQLKEIAPGVDIMLIGNGPMSEAWGILQSTCRFFCSDVGSAGGHTK